MATLHELLAGNAYPGRGIVWTRLTDGSYAAAYFLTGRSEASRRREIRLSPQRELSVVPTDETAEDDLRHYEAAVETPAMLVYGNGRQVSTVQQRLAEGEAPVVALQDLEYEPDPPILTARITGVVDRADPSRAWFGVARRPLTERRAGVVATATVTGLEPGDAVVVTTYRTTDPAEVLPAPIYEEGSTGAADLAELADDLWASLSPERRVAVATFRPGALAEAVIRD